MATRKMAKQYERRPWYRKGRGWYFTVVDPDGKRKHVFLARKKSEAMRKFRDEEFGPGSITVNALVAEYLTHIRGDVKDSTFKAYARSVRSFAQFESVGTYPAADVKRFDLTRWLHSKSDRWGKMSERAAIQHVKTMFAWAATQELLDRSPVASVKLPPPVRRRRLLRPDQFERILTASPLHLRLFLLTMHASWARPDSVRRMTAADVSHDFKTILLMHHKTEKTGRPLTLYVCESIRPLIRWLCQCHPDGPLLRNSRGQAWTSAAVSRAFARVRDALGMEPGVVAYLLRHTGPTTALVNGTDLETVRQLLGHADIRTTSQFYSHVDDPAHREHLLAAIEGATRRSMPALANGNGATNA